MTVADGSAVEDRGRRRAAAGAQRLNDRLRAGEPQTDVMGLPRLFGDSLAPPLADPGGEDESRESREERGYVEIHPRLPMVNPNLVFGSTMALWQPPRFTPQELLDTINEILEGTGAAAVFDAQMRQADQQPKFSLLKRRLRGPPAPSSGSMVCAP